MIIRGVVFDMNLILMNLDLKKFLWQTSLLKDKISCYWVGGNDGRDQWILRELRRILCWELGDFQWFCIDLKRYFSLKDCNKI